MNNTLKTLIVGMALSLSAVTALAKPQRLSHAPAEHTHIAALEQLWVGARQDGIMADVYRFEAADLQAGTRALGLELLSGQYVENAELSLVDMHQLRSAVQTLVDEPAAEEIQDRAAFARQTVRLINEFSHKQHVSVFLGSTTGAFSSAYQHIVLIDSGAGIALVLSAGYAE